MPNYEFMCFECGHTFEIFAQVREAEAGLEVECPVCGSTDTTRTYDEEDTEVSEEELEEGKESDEDDDFKVNLDDE